MFVKQYEKATPTNIDIIKLFITMYFLFLNASFSLCISDVEMILLAIDITSMFFSSVMFSIFNSPSSILFKFLFFVWVVWQRKKANIQLFTF